MATESQYICCSGCKHASWTWSDILHEEYCKCRIHKSPSIARGCEHQDITRV